MTHGDFVVEGERRRRRRRRRNKIDNFINEKYVKYADDQMNDQKVKLLFCVIFDAKLISAMHMGWVLLQ